MDRYYQQRPKRRQNGKIMPGRFLYGERTRPPTPESAVVRALVDRCRTTPMRSTSSRVTGRGKKFKPGTGTSVNLTYLATMMLGNSEFGNYPCAAGQRIHKRVMKKLRQPFRRKPRGPLRRRASGKNEIRPRRQ